MSFYRVLLFASFIAFTLLLNYKTDMRPLKISHQRSAKVLIWNTYGDDRGLTWSNRWKNWPVAQKWKVSVVVVIAIFHVRCTQSSLCFKKQPLCCRAGAGYYLVNSNIVRF